jgi:LacI family transcriptional regulator
MLAAMPPLRRPTMSEVARRAGCSQSTVSLVLNEIPNVRIAEETRRRVREAARTIGYQAPRPRLEGGGAAMGVIGFVVDRLATSAEAVVSADGAREAAWASGRMLLIVSTLSDPEVELRSIEALLARPVDGLVYASIMTRRVEPPALLRRTRSVLLNCYGDDLAHPAVVPGEVAGGHAATQRLIAAGHARIGVINGEAWMDAARDRFKGYRRALATADIPYDPELVRDGNWEYGGGHEHTRSLMALRRPPTAIFCANDRTAVGCYAALGEMGLRIPGDVAVIGYDDQEVAQHLTPQLTTMLLPHREMGQWAVERLLEGDAGGGGPHPVVKLECPLVERESVAPPASR